MRKQQSFIHAVTSTQAIEKQAGFTVIELLVALSIVGILAGIAIPSYQHSLERSRRADAQGALMGLANAMERFYTVNNTYLGAAANNANSGIPDASVFSISANTATYYSLTIDAATTADSFVLNATPQGSQTNDSCGTLTLSNTGVKTPNTAGCW